MIDFWLYLPDSLWIDESVSLVMFSEFSSVLLSMYSSKAETACYPLNFDQKSTSAEGSDESDAVCEALALANSCKNLLIHALFRSRRTTRGVPTMRVVYILSLCVFVLALISVST